MRKKSVRKVLEDLGDTAFGVFKSLKAAKASGTPGSHESCPIANYLRREFSGACVKVNRMTALVSGYDEVDLPPACETFVDRFDDGHYHSLSDIQKEE